MAATALKAVPSAPMVSALVGLLAEMDGLRTEIKRIAGPHQNMDLSLGKDGLSFDLTITLNVGDDGKIACYRLETQPIPGCHFTKVVTRPVPHTVNRRLISALIVAPPEGVR